MLSSLLETKLTKITMKKIFITTLLLSSIITSNAQQATVSPMPQSIEGAYSADAFALPEAYQIITGNKSKLTFAIKKLEKLFPASSQRENKFKITIGLTTDKELKKYAKEVSKTSGAYFLKVSKSGITIAAQDERGAIYAISTLSQLIKDRKIAETTIKDFPDVPYRGVVEGFYGTPWSHSARLRQIDFYGNNKLNIYIYGPKDDPYHSVPSWRKPYPEKEAAQIKELVEKAKENGVIFYWAIHPGGDIKWNDTDRELLYKKFESMYSLGVRAFAVFFDDIAGEGTKAEKQAELLNYLNKEFVEKKKDIAPLVMCPTEYNKAWSNPKGGYLKTLGEKLDKNIKIMWTGNSVIACIDKTTMDWINSQIGRKAYIWWNFPVSDYVRDHLLLGAVYGNALNIKNDMSGFVSNPMERAEASKIALYSVADYSWNMEKYDSLRSWNQSMKSLLPSDYASLKTLAAHSSDLGNNGHGFRRVESVDLLPYLNALLESKGNDGQAAKVVETECHNLSMAADILMVNKDNPEFIAEVMPWLKQAKVVGEYGRDVISMLACNSIENTIDFEKYYIHAVALQDQMYKIDVEENQNPYQPGVKIGSKELLPALNKLFSMATIKYNEQTNLSLSPLAEYKPYDLKSSVAQLSSLPIRTKGKQANVSPSNEVIKWDADKSLEIEAKEIVEIKALSLDLGTASAVSDFVLETSTDGTNWVKISLQERSGKTVLVASEAIKEQKTKYIRLRNISGKDLQVYMRSFQFSIK